MALIAHTFTPRPRDPQQARIELEASCDAIRLAISQAGSVKEAWAIYEHVKFLASELTQLVDLAGARAEHLLEKM